MTEWKDLGEVSRGQQDISFIHEGHEKTQREDFKENGHVQASAPEWSYGAEVMGLPLRASSQAAPSLLHHPFQGSKPVHDENRFA